jgi:glycosyltransferase involved in cell wall biosynthesis
MPKRTDAPRVAIVQSWLNQYGGAERILEQLHDLFPEAPIYTSMFEPRVLPEAYQSWDIRTSFLQHVPLSRTKHQLMLFLYPLAFESFDLAAYDLVLSLSSGFSHGARAGPGGRHVCYCLTPARFLWTFDRYVRLEGVGRATRLALGATVPLLRRWDYRAAQRVNRFVGISKVVQERIRRFYGRPSEIIYPSIAVDSFQPSDEVDDYFLTASRLIPYKRIDLAIEACNRLKLPLKVVGDGRSRAALERLAGPTIEFLGKVDDPTLRRLYARCRAFIFPGEEDFGITPVEAMAAGRPVIAYAAGGALDSIAEGVTGRFFHEQSAAALAAAVAASRCDRYDPGAIRRHAEGFGRDVFLTQMREFIHKSVSD